MPPRGAKAKAKALAKVAKALGLPAKAKGPAILAKMHGMGIAADDADALVGLLDEPYLDQGGQRARLVNTGFPPKGGRPLLSVTCSVASEGRFLGRF